MKNYVGNRLREARKQKNITQEQLSELTDVSVSEISRIETGRNSTTIDTLLKFCDVLDIGLDFLLYDYFPSNTSIKNPDIQHVVSIMESMDARHSKYIANLISIYHSSHCD
ncbi:MAG: helix-turn-helix transcriptional regulator [Eubacteriales bacterium]|nr:helix-turn-helix transcriptional regulator [Eubacteriales bacterium]